MAVLLDNEPAFFDAVWAGLRSGLYVTPINWHLTAAEAGYIVADCGATALVTSAQLGDTVRELGDDLAGVTVRLAVGGELEGFEPYEDVVSARELDAVPDECEGSWMFYSSGTTGRPKGIVPPALPPRPASFAGRVYPDLTRYSAQAMKSFQVFGFVDLRPA